MLDAVLSYLEEMGLTPGYLLIIIIISASILWLYKQVSNNMIAHQNQTLLDYENMLINYNTLYKSCIKFRDGDLTNEKMKECLMDSIRYLDKEHFIEIEKNVDKNLSMDESIVALREKIIYLRENIESHFPHYDKNKLSGRLLTRIFLFERIFTPVVFTFFSFIGLVILIFIAMLPVLKEFHLFFSSIITLFSIAYFYSLFLGVYENRFNHTIRVYIILGIYILIVSLILWIHNILLLFIVFMCSFVYILFSLQYLVKSK
ncbi:hypothetical protein ACQCT5_06815 [Sutcliffiella halmapala]